MSGRLQLDFDNLPLVEAVVRASLADPIKLKYAKLTDMHDALKGSFPHISEPQSYEAAPGVSEQVEFGPGQLTGAILEGHSRGLRCTLQSRVVVMRWVKQLISDSPDYPRYPLLRDTLWKVTDAVKAAYELASLPIAVVNMSYVNFLHVSDFATVLKDYFSPLVHISATDSAEEIRKVEVSWREKGIDLRFHLEKTTAKIGENQVDGCLLTTAAGMHVSELGSDATTALDKVHSRLQEFFVAIISDRAKTEWQLSGGA